MIRQLNHLGFLVAVVAATLGSVYMQKLQMTVYCDNVVEGPGIAIELHRFTVDYYDDMAPRRFASDISVYTDDGKTLRGTVEVNKPLKVNGWWIYQYDYDHTMGSRSPYSVFLLVKDPWLPAVYIGIILMLAGALSLIGIKYVPKRWWVLLAAFLLTVFFTFLTVSRMGDTARNPMPALQSPWFIPHLIVYMAGYAMLAMATLMALYLLFIRRAKTSQKDLDLTDNIVYVGLAFLTIGMLLGAIWAKVAWGHYWTWDPKETWAAVTWLCYVVYIHFRKAFPKEWRKASWILLLAFVCLQMCWWGINYLPSAQSISLHTY